MPDTVTDLCFTNIQFLALFFQTLLSLSLLMLDSSFSFSEVSSDQNQVICIDSTIRIYTEGPLWYIPFHANIYSLLVRRWRSLLVQPVCWQYFQLIGSYWPEQVAVIYARTETQSSDRSYPSYFLYYVLCLILCLIFSRLSKLFLPIFVLKFLTIYSC